jgi:hypothetical protein
MNSTELRERLDHLANAVKTTPPDIADLLDRPAPVVPIGRRTSQRRLVAVGLAGTSIAIGGAVAATGIFTPDEVHQRFDASDVEVGAIDSAAAVLRATHAVSSGGTYELWEAPNASGGICQTVLEAGDTTPSDQWASLCTVDEPPTRSLQGYRTFVVEDRLAIHGGAPGAATVVIQFNDGSNLVADVDFNDEFFTVTEQTCNVESNRCPIESITTLDAQGRHVDDVSGPD